MEQPLAAPQSDLEIPFDSCALVDGPIVKVGAHSPTPAVAGAIAGVFREHGHATIEAIGASAVNQAVKASVVARGYLALDGYTVILVPSFCTTEIDGQRRTALKLLVESR